MGMWKLKAALAAGTITQWGSEPGDKRKNGTKSKITPLNCSRAESNLLKIVLGRVQQSDILERSPGNLVNIQES